MKKAFFPFLLAFAATSLFALPVRAADEAAELNDLPAAVQKTARDVVGKSKIEEVEDTFEDGKRATEVEFLRGGKKMAVVISPEGSVIQLEHRMSVGDAPKKIKEAVLKEVPGSTLTFIKEVEKQGKTFFEVSVQSEGKPQRLKVTADGHVEKLGAKEKH